MNMYYEINRIFMIRYKLIILSTCINSDELIIYHLIDIFYVHYERIIIYNDSKIIILND
jgi:hypothetical protein